MEIAQITENTSTTLPSTTTSSFAGNAANELGERSSLASTPPLRKIVCFDDIHRDVLIGVLARTVGLTPLSSPEKVAKGMCRTLRSKKDAPQALEQRSAADPYKVDSHRFVSARPDPTDATCVEIRFAFNGTTLKPISIPVQNLLDLSSSRKRKQQFS